mmetsp:Transcript_7506/g.7944  ORF Transcript_7506/g.7944 Transcript_7506/m.7944 type:complete len:83 (+) Transcript_7506:84-332(+)|eukprot:CAMPEP_0174818168 /NCGR_PEP_ID=MMETSP1107-20130205/803_1 /TAXON_ID=36770 /ORGANISM="Paraphysomonas vestita, Strain GFlagA" /LENGTH=82 /DNA_ID=CAMNT_0016029663 /DNA_START=46 /DNA_END=294 /DNA_ORIENTATION=+
MASGFGLRGGPGRCFEHYQDIARCMEKAEDIKIECGPVYGDYIECLHGAKERERLMIIKYVANLKKKEAENVGAHGQNSGHH